MIIERDESTWFRDHEIPLGRVRTIIKSVRVADPAALRERLRSPGEVKAGLIPGVDDGVIRQRVPGTGDSRPPEKLPPPAADHDGAQPA